MSDEAFNFLMRECDALTLRLQQHFAKHTPRFRVPTVEQCRYLAEFMALIKRIGEREFMKTLKRPPVLKTLAYIEEEFRKVADAFAYAKDPREHHYSELSHKTGELLAACKEFGFGNDSDLIRNVADIAKRTLAVANDGKYPRSSGRDAPLTKLVSTLLGEIGMSRSPSTIEAVLQGLRRK